MVALINPPDPKGYTPSEGYEDLVYLGGIGYLDAGLKKKGINAKIVDAKHKKMSIDNIVDITRKEEIVGISCHWGTLPFVEELSKALKNKGKTIIIGGAFPSSYGFNKNNYFFRQNKNLDYCVIGEGEEILPDLIEHLNGNSPLPPNVLQRKDGEISASEQIVLPSRFENLEIDYTKFPEFIDSVKNKTLGIQTARGCYASCTFCYKLTGKTGIREQPLEKAQAELEWLIKNTHPRQVRFYEEVFARNKERAKSFSKFLNKREMPYTFMTRVNDVDEELADSFKKSGIKEIHVGVESFDPIVRKRIRKGLSEQHIEDFKRYTEKANLKVVGFLIAGLPGETDKSHKLTLEIIKDWPNFIPRMRPLMPIPGTALYYEALNQGKITEEGIYNSLRLGYVDSMQQENLLVNMSEGLSDSKILNICRKVNSIRKERMLNETLR